ncbi:hypothetical protein [Lacrimispora sp.]|uniref:hypothetical protein n=1 Tax=Lacrimispora sp. TaxID=2719234 RepID=UPI0028AA47F3|nr:hypothetical protein [Lacrimispora sp.]
MPENTNNEDYEVIIRSTSNDGTEVITSSDTITDKWLASAVAGYDPSNQKYSAYLKDGNSPSEKLTPEYIDELADGTQNDLRKIQIINSIVRKEINKDGIIGKTHECITTNINTKTKLSYDMDISGRNKSKQLQQVKDIITEFNQTINIKRFIRNSIPTTFDEGNYICYLRHENNRYKIDYYPIGVCVLGDYDINGDPIVLFNIRELRSRLQKIYRKTKKNKPLFFSDMEEEVKANYPQEVYDAFIAKEDFAKLDFKYSGVIRINNMNRNYGLTPIFRTFKDLLMLDTFDNADRVNSKAKAKKIIHQKLRKEVMGTEGNKKGFEEMSYAHQNFMAAWKQPTVVVTTPPTVEEILYVEPKIELTDTKTVNNYRSRVLAALGISFLMDSGSQSVSTSDISVTQLMRTINMISEQVEDILQKWYKQVLVDNNLPVEFCPTINVIDSEELSFEMRKDLASTLYTIFNGSLTSSLELLGIDVNDEKAKRSKENDEGFEQIFKCRQTAYTSSGRGEITEPQGNKGGRPTDNKNKAKQKYDQIRQETL